MPEPAPITLRRFIRRTDEGMQRPPIFEADDGFEYVLKLDTADADFPAAEMVAAGLAAAFLVPIPEFRVLTVPQELVDGFVRSRDPTLVEFAESFIRRGGRCFGSRYLGGVTVKWTAALRRRVEDADRILANLLVFDAFIENGDRSSASNPNLLVSNRRLYAIDHGQSLPSVQGLTGKQLPYAFDSHLAWPIIAEAPAILTAPTANVIALTDNTIDDAVASVPLMWWTTANRPEAVRLALRRRRDELPGRLQQLVESSP